MTSSHPLSAVRRTSMANTDLSQLSLCLVGAACLVASGAIHLHLWNQYYRHITTGHMNDLFLVQWILCFVGAAAVLSLRNLLAVGAGAALLAGTFVGYLLARYHAGGLFGFALPNNFSSSDATWAMVVEIAGTVILAAAALRFVRRRSSS